MGTFLLQIVAQSFVIHPKFVFMESTTTTETNMIINLDVTYNETTEMYEGTPREKELPFFFTANEIEFFDLEMAARVRGFEITEVVIHYNTAS